MALDPRTNDRAATDSGVGREESLQTKELQALFAVSKALATEGTLKEKTERALEEVVGAFSAGVVVLRVPNEEGTALRLVATAGPATEPNTPPPYISLEGTVGGEHSSGTSRLFSTQAYSITSLSLPPWSRTE